MEQEKAAIDKALDSFAEDCRARLYDMADRGKRGWDDPQWSEDIATDLAIDAQRAKVTGDRKKLHDIANRAMMLWWQAWGKPAEKQA